MKTILLNIFVAALDILGVTCLCYGLYQVWPPLSFMALGGLALATAQRVSKLL